MKHTEDPPRVLRYTLAVSVDPNEYSANNSPYCVEDMVLDEVASYLYTVRYVVDVDIRRSSAGASRPSLSIHHRRDR